MGILLGDWATTAAKIYGFSAMIMIIAGIFFTSYQSGHKGKRSQWGKGIAINTLSSLGFAGYVAVLKYYHIDGWDSLLPQSVGQIAGIIAISLLFFRTLPFNKATTSSRSDHYRLRSFHLEKNSAKTDARRTK